MSSSSFGELAAAWIRRQPIDIVMLGPGSGHADGWSARCLLRDQLRALGDRVEFPEDAIAGTPLLQRLELHAAEWALIQAADAVVALVVEDPRVSGVLTELGQFLADPAHRYKFVLVEPTSLFELTQGSDVPYTFQLWNSLHRSQRLAYHPSDFANPAKAGDIAAEVAERLLPIRWRRLMLQR